MSDAVKKRFVLGFVGSLLSGIGFFCMMLALPLVGPAGTQTNHAIGNLAVFVLIALFTFVVSVATILILKKSGDGMAPIRVPIFLWAFAGISVVMLLITGLFKL